MISKELLSEVIDKEIVSTPTVYDNEIEVYFTLYYFDNIGSDGVGEPTSSTEVFYTNIHELAHKVKEWAFDEHNLTIESRYFTNDFLDKMGDALIFTNKGHKQTTDVVNAPDFISKAEPEAIFKAGQWILENR